jgi:sporulation protein YlmC with PRC-barrel domain
MKVRKLLGKEVIDTQGNKIGKVDEIDVDMVNVAVNHITVKVGLTLKYEITLDKIMTIGDKMILKIKKDELGRK